MQNHHQQQPGIYVPSQANYQPLNNNGLPQNQNVASSVPSQFLPPQPSYPPQQQLSHSAPPGVYVPVNYPPQHQQANYPPQSMRPTVAPQQQPSAYNPQNHAPPQTYPPQTGMPMPPQYVPSAQASKPLPYATATMAYPSPNNNTVDPALYNALADTERLIIKQEIEYGEAIANAAANAINMDKLGAFGEQANRYDIFTDNGGKKFRVVETSQYLWRCCCRPNHPLQLHVFLAEQQTNKVLVLDRPWKCGHCISVADICQQEMKVYQGDAVRPGDGNPDPSKMIGVIKQPVLGGLFSPKLNVMDRDGGENIATIQSEAKCCIGGMCCTHTFHVTDPRGNYMGKIVKERPGNLAQIAKELTTDADNFTLYVPKDMPVQNKANMLAALHLIDYMFFEDEGDLNVDVANQHCTYKLCDFFCCGAVFPCKLSCQRCGKRKEQHPHYGQKHGHHGPPGHHKKHHPPPHHHHPPHHPPHHHLSHGLHHVAKHFW